MKKENIILLQTEEGNIVKWEEIQKLDRILDTDIVITQDDIKELAETEMDEGNHDDYIEDYENEIEFYLSNVTRDSYTQYIQDILDDKGGISNELAVEIQLEVEKEIRNRF